MGNLHPPASRQVAVVVKFLLQLQDLLAGVGGPRALGFPTGVIGVYWTHTERRRKRKFKYLDTRWKTIEGSLQISSRKK